MVSKGYLTTQRVKMTFLSRPPQYVIKVTKAIFLLTLVQREHTLARV